MNRYSQIADVIALHVDVNVRGKLYYNNFEFSALEKGIRRALVLGADLESLFFLAEEMNKDFFDSGIIAVFLNHIYSFERDFIKAEEFFTNYFALALLGVESGSK